MEYEIKCAMCKKVGLSTGSNSYPYLAYNIDNNEKNVDLFCSECQPTIKNIIDYYISHIKNQPERSKREDLPNTYNPNNYKSWCSCCKEWIYCSNCNSEYSNCKNCIR